MSSAENPIQTRGKNDASAADQATDECAQDCSAGWTVTDWLMLLSVTIIALIIRLVYNHQLQSSPFFANPSLDAKLHVDWAIAIAENRSLFEGVYARAPLYPWLLGGLYSLTGVDYFIPRVISAIMGSISCGLLFAISRRALGRWVALVAGLALATYWVSVYFEGELLVEPLSVFLNLIGIWLLMRTDRRGWPTWAMAGLCFGLSALNRPNVLLAVPVLACWPFIIHGLSQWKRGAGFAIVFLAACILVVLPVTIRNFIKGGEAIPIAANGGLNFYMGNNPQSNGMSAILPGVRADWWGAQQDAKAIAEASVGRTLSAGEVSRFYYRAGVRFILDEPWAAFRLFAHKLRFFWNDVEAPNPYNLYFFTDKYTPIVRYLPLTFGMLVPFAFLGVIFSGKKRLVGQFPLWGFGLAYMASVVMFFVTSRFRLLIVPIVIVYAAFGVVQLLRLIANRKWLHVGGGVAAVVLSWPLLHTEDIAGLTQHPVSYCKVARILTLQKEYDKAEDACREAIRIDPELALAHETFGHLELARGNLPAGIKNLREAIRLDADRPVYHTLADALIFDRRFSEASRVLQKGTDALPGQIELKVKLIWLWSTCPDKNVRNGGEALAISDQLIRQYAPIATVLDARAAALAEVGRYDEAIETAEQALKMVDMSKENESLRREMAQRIDTYRSRRPYRQE